MQFMYVCIYLSMYLFIYLYCLFPLFYYHKHQTVRSVRAETILFGRCVCVCFQLMHPEYLDQGLKHRKCPISVSIINNFFLTLGFIYLFIYLFIYGCVGSSFLCEGFLQLRQVGATLHRGVLAFHYCGLSCCGAQDPDAQAQ